jgi:transcriptional regulator with XRE-family HTH domain
MIGTEIRNRRRECGVTLAELAHATGYSKSMLSAVETGERKASRELLERVGAAFARLPVVCPSCGREVGT